GPRLPRADREGDRARYCRLMLILFVPWRSPEDLRHENESWQDAFARHQPSFKAEHLDIMQNMRITDECKDSRDD
ncbi:hypothetical protein C2E23DRAFT_693157, partial [Lenzites betulinus]